jgi:hypothetical protein
MNRRLWLIAVALLIVAGAARTAAAAKALSIEKMDELLAPLHGKPDGKVAGQLRDVQLTERVSAARLAQWEADFPGARTHEALMKLADMSAFLDPPASDVVQDPRPDIKTQLQILSLAAQYVTDTMPRLPDFYATRVTTHFENSSSQLGFSKQGAAMQLHPAGAYTRMVTYRDGKEVPYESAGKRKQEPAASLTTTGEFGPILAVVVGDALHGKLHWLRWDQGDGGPAAVFSYAVPQADSHFMVGRTAKSDADGILPAYHGEIAINPATGAILRLSQFADLTPPYQEMRAQIVVEYAPVTIAGRSYVCPVRGVAFSAIPVNLVAAPNTATNIGGVPTHAAGEQSSWPIKAELNDVAFTNYHEFRADARIVTTPAQSETKSPSQ